MNQSQKILPYSSQLDTTERVSALTANVVEDYREAIDNMNAARADGTSSPSLKSASLVNVPVDDEDTSVDGSSDGDSSRKRTRESGMSSAELLEDRRSKNRRSAHESRLRKRRQLVYFEQQVHLLMEENKKLSTANETMTGDLEAIHNENAQLRLMHEQAVKIAHTLRLSHGGGDQDAARMAHALRLGQGGGDGDAARMAHALRLGQAGTGPDAARIAQALRLGQAGGGQDAARIAQAMSFTKGVGGQDAARLAQALRGSHVGGGQEAARIALALRGSQGGGEQEAARIAHALRGTQGSGEQEAARIAQALRGTQGGGEREAAKIAQVLRLIQGGGGPGMFRHF